MEEKTLISEIEKSFENFSSSILDIQKAYGKLWQRMDSYKDPEIVPRDYLKEMAGNLAHEIRNPLGGIANFAQLISDNEELRQSKNLQGILQGVERIDKIVENLIVFSKPVAMHSIQCNFVDVVCGAVESIKDILKVDKARHQFFLNLPKNAIYLKLDPQLMLQALQNVLQNAVEFTPEGGEITVVLTENEQTQKVILCVGDNGQELTEENRKKAFYPFFTTKTHGMGLGLPTSRLVVEKHGGKIWLRKHPKKGAVVVLTLPRTK